MKYQEPPVTQLSDKFLGFCAVTPNRKFMKLFRRADIKNILISYHYIRKNPKYTEEILKTVRERGGLFMTDSGTFSFIHDKNFDSNKFDWVGYLTEYVAWLEKNKDYIFSACNLDVDHLVGHDIVNRWNEKYFEPLEKDMNIIYVAQPNSMGGGDLDTLNKYCDRYDYVAVNEGMIKHVSAVYQKAKLTKTTIHGLAWTKPSHLKDFPFFSVDSSSWVNYQKYGATPVWDGRNFSQYDKDNKDIRKTLRNQCIKYGVSEYEFIHEEYENGDKAGQHNDDEGLTFSLRTWIDVFQDLKRYARTKLNHTLLSKLEGKKVVFIEDIKNSTPTHTPSGSKIMSTIQRALGEEAVITETAQTTYKVNEDGSEVAMYEKREKKSSIIEYTEEAGDTMVCNYCHIADKCPKFKQDATCGFDFAPAQITENPLAVIDSLIKTQSERVQRAMLFEKMEGGMPNKVFAGEVKLLNDLNNTKVNMLMMMQGKGLEITKTTTVKMNTGNAEPEPKKEGGFASMLQGLMKS